MRRLYDEDLLYQVILPALQSTLKECKPKAVYVIGSFSSRFMWQPGISDIDILMLTRGQSRPKLEIDITENCRDYIKSKNLEHLYTLRSSQLFVVSCAIWNYSDFMDSGSWKRLIKDGRHAQVSIIEDQLLAAFTGIGIGGTEELKVTLRPEDYRNYLNGQYRTQINSVSNITVLMEAKRIIYACRVFMYLWRGDYFYEFSKLQDEVDQICSCEIGIALEKAIKMKADLVNMEWMRGGLQTEYFKETASMYRTRQMITEKLLIMDHKYCRDNKVTKMKDGFIHAYGEQR